MTNKPKAIGTAFETAVVRHFKANRFDSAERIALHGVEDEGDVTVCPDVMAECKAGHAAENASDAVIAQWLVDTERERVARGVSVALLVWKRKGKGATNAGQWWVAMPGWMFVYLHDGGCDSWRVPMYEPPKHCVRMTLDEAIVLLHHAGYPREGINYDC